MAKSTRSKIKRAYRAKKRETGVYAVAEAARLQRLNTKLSRVVASRKEDNVPLEGSGKDDDIMAAHAFSDHDAFPTSLAIRFPALTGPSVLSVTIRKIISLTIRFQTVALKKSMSNQSQYNQMLNSVLASRLMVLAILDGKSGGSPKGYRHVLGRTSDKEALLEGIQERGDEFRSIANIHYSDMFLLP